MPALSLTADLPPYTPLVKTGRPAKRERTPFGQRLHTLREQAGLSQQQLADRLGLTQRAYAHWERNPVALRPDQLLGLAEALNVSVEDLVGSNGTKKRGTGPTGKMNSFLKPPLNSRAASNKSLPPSSNLSSLITLADNISTAISAIRMGEIPNADDLFLVTHVAIPDLQPIPNLGLIIGCLVWCTQWIKAKTELFDARVFRMLQFTSFGFVDLIEVVDLIINSPLFGTGRHLNSLAKVINI